MPCKPRQTISIFGQISEAAANYLLRKYPNDIVKIPLEWFPERDEYNKNVWVDEHGTRASFALNMPAHLELEFNRVARNLRA